jgi:hypothetical protein
MKISHYLPFLVSISLACQPAPGQGMIWSQHIESFPEGGATVSSKASVDLFASEELLEMTLIFDVSEFLKSRNEPRNVDATMILKTDDNQTISRKIKIKARGGMRRSYCSFPPIMLKFNNDDSNGFQKPGKQNIKLVTHCNRSPLFRSYLMKEYLAYKLYNQITPYSFKTRLVRISYADSHNPNKIFTAYGFMIEDEDDMAERNHAVVLNNKSLTQKNMNSQDMARLAVFNYMIGNTDWSVPQLHNIIVIKTLEAPSDKGIPVAYDFDYSGFVNPVYAVPFESYPIESVKERYYIGRCFADAELDPVIEELEGKKEMLIGTIKDFGYLSNGYKKQQENYLNSFFDMCKDQPRLMTDLNRTCRR